MKGVKCLDCGTNTFVIIKEKKRSYAYRNRHASKSRITMGCTICGRKEVIQ